MRRRILHLLHPVLRRVYSWYSRKPRRFRRDGLDLIVLPGVFHPGFFHSTGALSRYIGRQDLKGRTFLELGAGAGRVALTAARAGAIVTASDINPAAIENLKLNSERNKLLITVVESDLFEHLPQHFDVIAINPPYYAHDPRNDVERAFFAGGGHDYFMRLFPALAERVARGTQVYVVLSKEVDLGSLGSIAAECGITFVPLWVERHSGEAQFIFRYDQVLHDPIRDRR